MMSEMGVAKTNDDSGDLSRIATIPNLVTALRLSCLPLFVWLALGAHKPVTAGIVLAILGATDWVDGYVARHFHQVSNLGKVLDPVADRLLLFTAVITIIVDGAVPLWLAIATLAREALISVTTVVLASMGARRIDVLWVGKAGTFALMFSFPGFLFGFGPAGWQADLHHAAVIVGVIGLALAWTAAASYLPKGRQALADGRGDRLAAGMAP